LPPPQPSCIGRFILKFHTPLAAIPDTGDGDGQAA
jgi:hypothetical protein